MKIMFFAIASLAAAGTLTGVVTDTMCGAKHTMMKDAPDEKCVKMCVKGSSEFALFDGQKVYKLSDQSKPAKFAAQKVRVTGTLKNGVIKVEGIEAF